MTGRTNWNRESRDVLTQIEDDVLIGDGCWQWTGAKNEKGYAIVYRPPGESPRKVRVHRFLYEILVGPIADGLQLDHTCHNHDLSCAGGVTCQHRACVNPGHLEPVTPKINVRRGRRCKTTVIVER